MAKFVEDGNKNLKACAKPLAKLMKLMLGDDIEGMAEGTQALPALATRRHRQSSSASRRSPRWQATQATRMSE